MKTSTKILFSVLISIIIVALLWYPLGYVFSADPSILAGLVCLVPILSVVLFVGFSLSCQLDQVEELLKELKEEKEKDKDKNKQTPMQDNHDNN